MITEKVQMYDPFDWILLYHVEWWGLTLEWNELGRDCQCQMNSLGNYSEYNTVHIGSCIIFDDTTAVEITLDNCQTSICICFGDKAWVCNMKFDFQI